MLDDILTTWSVIGPSPVRQRSTTWSMTWSVNGPSTVDDMVRHRSVNGRDFFGSMGRISGSAQALKTSSGGGGTHQSTVNVWFHEIGPTLQRRIHSLGNPK
jgi:hypothetical protein